MNDCAPPMTWLQAAGTVLMAPFVLVYFMLATAAIVAVSLAAVFASIQIVVIAAWAVCCLFGHSFDPFPWIVNFQ